MTAQMRVIRIPHEIELLRPLLSLRRKPTAINAIEIGSPINSAKKKNSAHGNSLSI
jgi:hypothetical protein